MDIMVNSINENVTIPITKQVGDSRSEPQVRYILDQDNEAPITINQHRPSFEDNMDYDFLESGGQSRRELRARYDDVVDFKLEDTEYTPVMFNLTLNGTEDQALFEEINTVLRTHTRKMHLTIKDGDKEYLANSSDLNMLSQEKVFHKNSDHCRKGNGVRTNTNSCLYYYKISKICLLLDFGDDPATSAVEDQWYVSGTCGIYHKEAVHNSSDFRQLISFYGYPITVQLRSAKDPHI